MKLLLQAFKGHAPRIPVWFMRQAGRSLPAYRKVRARHSLDAMFTNADIIAEVTCQPVEILKVDAAILFADILTLPKETGFLVRFDKNRGPVIGNPLRSLKDLERISDFQPPAYQQKAIPMIRERLPVDTALIGFAGGPFTVLTYLIEGGSSTGFQRTLRLMLSQPRDFDALMERMTALTIAYLKHQKDAGIEVFQIFDSWAGILRPADYERHVLPFVQQIFEEVPLPSIYYLKNCGHLMPAMARSGAQFLSVDETVDIGTDPVLTCCGKGVQGNLYNQLLFADDDVIRDEIRKLLNKAAGYPCYIFNLSHGILPDTDTEKVKLVIEQVRLRQTPVII